MNNTRKPLLKRWQLFICCSSQLLIIQSSTWPTVQYSCEESKQCFQISSVDPNLPAVPCGSGLFPLLSPHAKAVGKQDVNDQQLYIFIWSVGKINDSIKMQYTLSAPQQRSVYSPVMDTLRGLPAAACFCQQTFSQTLCLLCLQALSKQTKIFITHRKDLNTHFASCDNS